MSVTAKTLFESTAVAVAQTPLYQVPVATRTIVDKFTGYNSSATVPATLTVNIIPSGGGAVLANVLVVKTLQPGETYTFPEVTGQVLAAQDIISVLPSTATINIRGSGREVS